MKVRKFKTIKQACEFYMDDTDGITPIQVIIKEWNLTKVYSIVINGNGSYTRS